MPKWFSDSTPALAAQIPEIPRQRPDWPASLGEQRSRARREKHDFTNAPTPVITSHAFGTFVGDLRDVDAAPPPASPLTPREAARHFDLRDEQDRILAEIDHDATARVWRDAAATLDRARELRIMAENLRRARAGKPVRAAATTPRAGSGSKSATARRSTPPPQRKPYGTVPPVIAQLNDQYATGQISYERWSTLVKLFSAKPRTAAAPKPQPATQHKPRRSLAAPALRASGAPKLRRVPSPGRGWYDASLMSESDAIRLSR